MIGKVIEYIVKTDNGLEKRKANVKKIEFNNQLGKPIFTAVTPFKNTIRLTRDEILRFL